MKNLFMMVVISVVGFSSYAEENRLEIEIDSTTYSVTETVTKNNRVIEIEKLGFAYGVVEAKMRIDLAKSGVIQCTSVANIVSRPSYCGTDSIFEDVDHKIDPKLYLKAYRHMIRILLRAEEAVLTRTGNIVFSGLNLQQVKQAITEHFDTKSEVY